MNKEKIIRFIKEKLTEFEKLFEGVVTDLDNLITQISLQLRSLQTLQFLLYFL